MKPRVRPWLIVLQAVPPVRAEYATRREAEETARLAAEHGYRVYLFGLVVPGRWSLVDAFTP